MDAFDNPEASGRTYGGESAVARALRQRQAFLQAGLQCFGTEGYHATTVRGLCKQAGLTDRYFYKNFASTEDLLMAVYNAEQDRMQAEVFNAMQAQMAAGNDDAVLFAGLNAFFAAVENPLVARICWLEVLGVGARVQAMYMDRVQRYASLLLQVARMLKVDLPSNADEANFVALGLVGAVSQTAMNWLLSGHQAPRQTLVAATMVILRGAMRNPRATVMPQTASP